MTRRDFRLFFLFFIIPAFFFFYKFFLGKTYFIGDILYSFQPWLSYTAQIIQSGNLPLWDPYTAGGQPFMANPQTMLFFPIAQLFWIFPFSKGWGLFLFINQLFLSLACYLVLKKTSLTKNRLLPFLASLAFTWGGFVVVLWEFPSAMATLPWLFLFLLFSWTRHWLFLILTTLFLALSGYPQFSVYIVLFTGIILFAESTKKLIEYRNFTSYKLFFLWGGAILFGVLLASLQVGPTWELTRESIRSQISLSEAKQYLINPFFLIKYIIPEIFNKLSLPFQNTPFSAEFWPVQRNWLNTFFMGTAPFLLALIGLFNIKSNRNKLFGFLVFSSLLLAMGIEPFFTWFKTIVPGLKYMTHFSNIMLLVNIAFLYLMINGAKNYRINSKIFWFVWGSLILTDLFLIFIAPLRLALMKSLLGLSQLTSGQDRWIVENTFYSFISLLLITLLLKFSMKKRLLGIFLLTFIELWLFGRDFHPFVNSSFFEKPIPLAKKLQKEGARLAIHPQTLKDSKPIIGSNIEEGYQNIRQSLYPNTHLPYRITSIWGGYDAFLNQSFAEFRRTLDDQYFDKNQIQFMGGHYILSTYPLKKPAKPIMRSPFAYLYSLEMTSYPLMWVPKTVFIPHKRDRLNYIEKNWDSSQEVIIEVAPQENTPIEKPTFSWERTSSRIKAWGNGGAGWLVSNDVFSSGWVGYLNGQPIPIYRANNAFKAVPLTDKPWEIIFIYRSKYFMFGLAITLVFLFIFLSITYRRTKNSLGTILEKKITS